MSINVTENDTIDQAVASVKDADGNVLANSAVSFSSSDDGILSVVDNGDGSYTATAHELGTANVIVTVGDLSIAEAVNVLEGAAASVELGEPRVTVNDAPVVEPPADPDAPADNPNP